MVTRQRNIGTELSFALHGAANRMVRLHKPLLEPLGLTFPQYLVVLVLLDEAPLSVGDLGARVDMDTGTITPLVKRLAEAELVTRTRDVADERRVLVELTARGRALEDEVRGISGKIKTACRLTHADLEELRGTLDGLARPQAAGVVSSGARR